MRVPRRLIVSAVLSPVLGGVTAIAVAWGLALWMPQSGWSERVRFGLPREWAATYPDGSLELVEWRSIGSARAQWWWATRGRASRGPFVGTIGNGADFKLSGTSAAEADTTPIFSKWSGILSPVVPEGNQSSAGMTHVCGFPFLCASYDIEAGGQVTPANPAAIRIKVSTPGGINLTPTVNSATAGSEVRALPLRPIWPGLIANTGVYAAGWFVVLYLGAVVIGLFRKRIGHCPHCGYARVGLANDAVCPECGKLPAVTEHAAASSSS